MSSLVAMPSAKGLSKVSDLVTREAMSEAVKSGTSAQLADKIGELFQHFERVEGTIAANKSLTGAYVHRASRDANGGVVDSKAVNERLGVQTSTRYGYIARLYFDFSFDPADGADWTRAIRFADKDKGFRELLGKPAGEVQKQDLLDYMATADAEKESARGERKNRPASEKDGQGDKGGDTVKITLNNDGRNQAIAELLNQWQTSDASVGDVAGLMANVIRAQSLLRFVSAETFAEAKAIVEKDDTVTPATVAKRKRGPVTPTSATSAK